MTLVLLVWLTASAIVIGVLTLASAQAPLPASWAPVAHPRASMRLVFVSVQADRVLIDGLLDLDPPSFGVPTAWSFVRPDHPVLTTATLHVLERWADDGLPVVLDLSKVTSSHPSVAFSRGEVLVRLSALPRHSSHEQAR